MTPAQIKFFRLAQGLRQHDLGKRIGASQARVSNLERGAKPKADEAEKLREVLGIPGKDAQ